MPMTEAQRGTLSMQFLLLDTDSDGLLDVSQVGPLLRSIGLYPTNAEVQTVVNLVDAEGVGKVSQEQLLPVVEGLWETNTTEEAMRQAFKVLNDGGNGLLTTAQLRHILVNLGTRLSHEEADEIIEDAEKNSDGQISVDELIEMLMGAYHPDREKSVLL